MRLLFDLIIYSHPLLSYKDLSEYSNFYIQKCSASLTFSEILRGLVHVPYIQLWVWFSGSFEFTLSSVTQTVCFYFSSVIRAYEPKMMPDEPDNETDVEECIKRLEDDDQDLTEVNINNMKRVSKVILKKIQ